MNIKPSQRQKARAHTSGKNTEDKVQARQRQGPSEVTTNNVQAVSVLHESSFIVSVIGGVVAGVCRARQCWADEGVETGDHSVRAWRYVHAPTKPQYGHTGPQYGHTAPQTMTVPPS